MSKSIIIFGDGDWNSRTAFDLRTKLVESTNLKVSDIHMICASPYLHNNVLLELEEALYRNRSGHPLLLIYVGFGVPKGWVVSCHGHSAMIPYSSLAKVLMPYQFPLLFVNCCSYSKTALPSFNRILKLKRREFGLITPYVEDEKENPAYFLQTQFVGNLSMRIPYDPSFWNLHAHDVMFGNLPPWKVEIGEHGFQEVNVEGDPPKDHNPARGKSRHGKIVDRYFWRKESLKAMAA